MSNNEQTLAALKQFLRTIQKPSKSIDNVAVDENLVKSGLIDSLAIVQIVVYLEQTYGIDFASIGFDPDRFSSMQSILELIEETRA